MDRQNSKEVEFIKVTRAYSTSDICQNLLKYCQAAVQITVEDSKRLGILDVLARTVSDLEDFIRGYEWINDPNINTTDEILNWAFSDAVADFCSAIWLLASGFYKASASSLRNAFDISVASLYFQIRENTDPHPTGYNRFFADWDSGRRPTPNWGEMKPFIQNQPSVARFKANTGVDILQKAHDHFKYLCAYTHTAAYANNGEPVTAINTTGVAPMFDAKFFERGREMVALTMSFVAILWQVTFPQIASTSQSAALEKGVFEKLFPAPWGPIALAHK